LNADPTYQTAMGKIDGVTLRLCLCFHLMQTPDTPTITADTMRQAVAAMQQFIVPCIRYAFDEIAGLKDDFETWVTEYIIQQATVKETVTLSEIRRSARRQVEDVPPWQTDERIKIVMMDLEKLEFVKLLSDGKSPLWTINPQLATVYKDYRDAVIAAKLEIVEEIKRTSSPDKHPQRA
jgi:hypothetical protein